MTWSKQGISEMISSQALSVVVVIVTRRVYKIIDKTLFVILDYSQTIFFFLKSQAKSILFRVPKLLYAIT